MKNRRLLDSFGFAVNGIIYCLRTQRNMRIHAAAVLVVILLSFAAKLSRIEVIMLTFAISLVLICEMINTAIEKSIDLFTDKYHPLAKIAKDVAAGAVFIAAANSLIIGYLVFFNRILPATEWVKQQIPVSELHVTVIATIITISFVVFIKLKGSSKNILQGGMPSGHAAVAFSLVTAAALLSENILVTFIAFMLGVLVLQSRVEAKIHSAMEVGLGAILGVLLTILVYKLFIL